MHALAALQLCTGYQFIAITYLSAASWALTQKVIMSAFHLCNKLGLMVYICIMYIKFYRSQMLKIFIHMYVCITIKHTFWLCFELYENFPEGVLQNLKAISYCKFVLTLISWICFTVICVAIYVQPIYVCSYTVYRICKKTDTDRQRDKRTDIHTNVHAYM